MILQKEIATLSEQKGVAKSTIDKDWALGHFIDAIYSIPKCRKSLVFKGGTCLKKCYFPDYRFSEDLDFTSIDPKFKLDRKMVKVIADLVTERTEMPIHIYQVKELKHKDKLTGYSAIIKFWGADHSRNQAPPPPDRWQTSIKIEVILYEEMIFGFQSRTINHQYSDQLTKESNDIPSYSLNEVMAEKLRSLIQRSYTAPRDFYDIWYLSKQVKDLDWSQIIEAFHQKMKFKGLKFTGIDQMINEDNDKRLQAAWKNSLAHQITGSDLPDYKTVKLDLEDLLNRELK